MRITIETQDSAGNWQLRHRTVTFTVPVDSACYVRLSDACFVEISK